MAKHTNFHRRKKVTSKPVPKRRESVFFVLLWGKNIASVLFTPLKGGVKLVLFSLSLWLGTGALIFGLSYYAHTQAFAAKAAQRQTLENRLVVWQLILAQHPTSREALLGAHSTSLSLGRSEDAQRYFEQLMRIDPNDSRVKELNTDQE